MGAHLRLYDSTNTVLAILPHFTGLEAADLHNDVGALSFDYAAAGLYADLLDTTADRTIGLWVDGEEVMRVLLDDDVHDDAGGELAFPVSGRDTLALLERGKVYPINGVGTAPASHKFTAATPGTIIRTLVQRAQARGAIPTVTVASFSNTLDSAGAAWAHTLSITYDAGVVNALDVVLDMASRGVIDVRMVGTDLRVYNPGTTLAPELPEVVLRRGRDLVSAPRTRTRREIATSILMVGENGKSYEAVDAAAVALYGRREGYEAGSGISDPGTLGVLAGLALTARKQPKVGHTTTLNLDAGGPKPWTDFDPGGWIRQDASDGTVTRVRVRGIAASLDQNGVLSAELELGDVFAEALVRIARQVQGITGGADATVGVPSTSGDQLSPATPGALAVTTAVYQQAPDGAWYAQATVDWPDVTTNSDGTAIDDLDGYLVSYLLPQQAGAQWSPEQLSATSLAHFSGLPMGRQFQARVRTRDRAGNLSGYATSSVVVLAADAAAPQTPSTPTVQQTIGGLRFTWDGLGADAQPMPADFDRAVLYVSTVAGFAPSTATARGDFVAAASVTLGGLPYVTHYAKLVAYDRSGNASAVSVEVSGTPRKVVGAAGGTTDLSSVTIGDADVGNLSVSKLVAGSLLADMVLAARIKTADTGARTEMSSVGFGAWNAVGVKTFEVVASTGAVTMRGTAVATDYYTDDTDPRIRMGPSATDPTNGQDMIAFNESSNLRVRGYITSLKYADGSGVIRLVGVHTGSDFGAGKPSGVVTVSGGDGTGDTCVVIQSGGGGGTSFPGMLFIAEGDVRLDAGGGGSNGYVWSSTLRLEPSVLARIVARNATSAAEGGVGTMRDWERSRVAVSMSAQASKDTSYSYTTAFTQRPVAVATVNDSGAAPLGNLYTQIFNSTTTGCTVRVRDVDGTARTGNTSVDLWVVF